MNKEENDIDLSDFFNGLKESPDYNDSDGFLLTFSGGVDSMVLLHSTYLCGIKPIIAHCNFQLRGDFSLQDELFAKQIALDYGLEIKIKKITIEKGKNTQLEARKLRYKWFKELMKKENLQYCLLGHHKSDQLETMLINIIRGTGIKGFLLPKKRGKIYRPLLDYTKGTIIKYALKHQLKWNEDSSNKETKYRRNYIRQVVIPHFKTLNPNIETTVARSINRIGYTQRYYQYGIGTIKKLFVEPYEDGIKIDIKSVELETKSAIDALLIYEFIREYGFTYKQCEEITGHSYSGDFHLANNDATYRLFIGRNHWYIFPIKNYNNLSINSLECVYKYFFWSYKFEILDKKPIFEGNNDIEYFSLSSLKMPLQFRLLKEGDRFLPFGMSGKSKKVTDFLTDRKVPLALKRRQVVLLDAEKIIWVVGHRTSETTRLDCQVGVDKYLRIQRNK